MDEHPLTQRLAAEFPGTSVNPARSTGPALVGAAIAGATYALLFGRDQAVVPLPEATKA